MSSKPFIYFDYAAATPVAPEVFQAMEPFFAANFANPSGIYRFAQQARNAVDGARENVAGILGCGAREILFTSGGTESNNLFIFGAAMALERFGRHIISTKIEHDSVLKPLEQLQARGFEITYLDVGEHGIVDAADVSKALRDDTIFITVMHANNEIGTIQPIAEIAETIKKHKRKMRRKITDADYPFFHTDACQTAAYLDLNADNLGVDSMTLSGSKIYGPKGAGALFVRENLRLMPQIFGGGQEYRMRSGTENVPAIVGFSKALGMAQSIAQSRRKKEAGRLCGLRDKLIDGILKIPQSRLNGHPQKRLPNNANVSFRGLEGENILFKLDECGIAASAGSACSSGSLETSHVLRALGLGEEWTHSATRFTLGVGSTKEDVDAVLKILPKIIAELRQTSPF